MGHKRSLWTTTGRLASPSAPPFLLRSRRSWTLARDLAGRVEKRFGAPVPSGGGVTKDLPSSSVRVAVGPACRPTSGEVDMMAMPGHLLAGDGAQDREGVRRRHGHAAAHASLARRPHDVPAGPWDRRAPLRPEPARARVIDPPVRSDRWQRKGRGGTPPRRPLRHFFQGMYVMEGGARSVDNG